MNLRRGDHILSQNILEADGFRLRLMGLMFKSDIPAEQGLWIKPCNWIHTFFMRIPIDVVYLNRQMQVVHIQKNLIPWKLGSPIWKAHSLIEFPAGSPVTSQLQNGDQIYVGH